MSFKFPRFSTRDPSSRSWLHYEDLCLVFMSWGFEGVPGLARSWGGVWKKNPFHYGFGARLDLGVAHSTVQGFKGGFKSRGH